MFTRLETSYLPVGELCPWQALLSDRVRTTTDYGWLAATSDSPCPRLGRNQMKNHRGRFGEGTKQLRIERRRQFLGEIAVRENYG